MKDKLIKENENFEWYETSFGVGYVVSKKAYFGFQPERLNEKTYYRNEDGTYPHLEPVIGCDSLNSTNK